MAVITNTVVTTGLAGIREDLEDVIYRVAPEETVVMSLIGSREKATATYHEWQTEDLRAPATNRHLEGDEATFTALNNPVRVGNHLQIFKEVGLVSRTARQVDTAGRDDEFDRQKLLKGIEVRRDVELQVTSNSASIARTGAVAGQSAGILAWLTTNVSRGATGANGGFNAGVVAAATNGTLRQFTEAQLQDVLQLCFDSSGMKKNRTAVMGSNLKRRASAFTGIAEIRIPVKNNNMATIVGAADVYASDFGEVTLIPHAYALTRDCLVLDPEMACMAALDGFKTVNLAKTGDADKFQITYEATLVCKNQKAHGVIADIQP